jgi:hypothetical protein
LATTSKLSCLKEAELIAQETAATEEEGETQAMLFALLQEQHDKQMATIATNKTKMDTMMERINDLSDTTGGKGINNKENTHPARNSTPTNNAGTKKPKGKKNSAQPAIFLFITAWTSVVS